MLQTGSRFCFASEGDKWRMAAATLSIWPRVLRNAGLVALLSFRAVEWQACIQTLDVWEGEDGFIQAQMKEDKQADPSAAGRLSEFISHFIPKAFVQNSILKILGETAPARCRHSPIRPAESSTSVSSSIAGWERSAQGTLCSNCAKPIPLMELPRRPPPK